MKHQLLFNLSLFPVIGIAIQWLAWRLRIPSILLLLITGLILGPVLGVLHPDVIFGEQLVPMVSICVALIVFEGGLNLNVIDLKRIGKAVTRLVSIGALISWFLTVLGAYFIAGLSFDVSILIGAILVVTGPTVILPMLRNMKVSRNVSSVLKWEAIVIDPIGALFALLVFDYIVTKGATTAAISILFILLKTIITGGCLGIILSYSLIHFLKRLWIPEYLQEAITLMFVIAGYTLSDIIQPESGLLTVTIMGIVLANQKSVVIRHIVIFKENLTVLLLSVLFLILSSRIQMDTLISAFGVKSLFFLLFIIFVARPASVFISTAFTGLSFRKTLFISLLAPRGIVAAAISSLFAIQLEAANVPHSQDLVTYTFVIIIGTVTFYSLTSNLFSRLLKLNQFNQGGVVIVGAHDWARQIAKTLKRLSISVLLIDTNQSNVVDSKLEGLDAIHGNIISSTIQDNIETGRFSRILALTSSNELNVLACLEYIQFFGTRHVYRLFPINSLLQGKGWVSHSRPGQYLFSEQADFNVLSARFSDSGIASETISDEVLLSDWKRHHSMHIPLFISSGSGELVIVSVDLEISLNIGDTLYYI